MFCSLFFTLKVRWFQKDFLVSSDSSKKWINKFVFSTVRQKNEFIRSFFGRIQGYQKSFRNYLTFNFVSMNQDLRNPPGNNEHPKFFQTFRRHWSSTKIIILFSWRHWRVSHVEWLTTYTYITLAWIRLWNFQLNLTNL